MLVCDANILVRAVLGSRVLWLIRKYNMVEFFAPDVAFREAREHLPAILDWLKQRNMPEAPAMAVLDSLSSMIETVDVETYGEFESVVRQRLARRDEDDCPVLASALALRPIWTEDTDFFGCGVATWTTDR